MTKKYDFLNDSNFDIDSYEREDLSEFEKERYKKMVKNSLHSGKSNKKSKKRFRIPVSIAAAVFGIFLIQSSGAETVNFFNNIKYTISEAVNSSEYKAYSDVVHKAVTSNGVTVQIEDIIPYENRMDVTFLMGGEPGYTYNVNNMELIIDGNVFRPSGGRGNSFVKDGVEYMYYSYTLDKNIEKMLSDDSKIYIRIRSLDRFADAEKTGKDREDSEKLVKGQWDFRFKGSRKMLDNSVVLKKNIKIGAGDYKAELKDVFIRPTGSIEMDLKTDFKSQDNTVIIEGENSKGEKIRLYTVSSDKNISHLISENESAVKIDKSNIGDFKFSMYISPLQNFGKEDENMKKIGESFNIK